MNIVLHPVSEALTNSYSIGYSVVDELYYHTPECNLFASNGFLSMLLLSDGNLWLNHDYSDLFFVRFDKRTSLFYLYHRQASELYSFLTSYQLIELFKNILSNSSDSV